MLSCSSCRFLTFINKFKFNLIYFFNRSILKAHLEDISPDPPLTLTTSFLHSHTRTVWQPLLNDSRFAGYSIMSVANLIPLLALGNLEGLVKIIHLSDTKSMSHKIYIYILGLG